MTSFQVMSDLHFEWHADRGREFIRLLPVEAETLILAGDITNFDLLEETLDAFAEKYRKVVYVCGNHEYYGHNVHDCFPQLNSTNRNVFILNNEVAVVDGVSIAGTTMWFPDHPLNTSHKHMLQDFDSIKDLDPWVYKENENARGFIKDHYDCDIILTHHMPSYSLVRAPFINSPMNRFFITPLLDEYDWVCQAKYWIFGHTHFCNDMMIGDTRCISNPFGYVRMEENPHFNPSQIITL
jgi:predicted phosphodiesterase